MPTNQYPADGKCGIGKLRIQRIPEPDDQERKRDRNNWTLIFRHDNGEEHRACEEIPTSIEAIRCVLTGARN